MVGRFAQGEKERATDKEDLTRQDWAHVSCGLEAGAAVWWGDQGGQRTGKTQGGVVEADPSHQRPSPPFSCIFVGVNSLMAQKGP